MTTRLKPESYKDFLDTFHVDVPANYNFAFDTLDELAAACPEKIAMVHVGPDETRHEYDFAFFRDESMRLANALKAQGLNKG